MPSDALKGDGLSRWSARLGVVELTMLAKIVIAVSAARPRRLPRDRSARCMCPPFQRPGSRRPGWSPPKGVGFATSSPQARRPDGALRIDTPPG